MRSSILRVALLWVRQWGVIESYLQSFLFYNLSHQISHHRIPGEGGPQCGGLGLSVIVDVDVESQCPEEGWDKSILRAG